MCRTSVLFRKLFPWTAVTKPWLSIFVYTILCIILRSCCSFTYFFSLKPNKESEVLYGLTTLSRSYLSTCFYLLEKYTTLVICWRSHLRAMRICYSLFDKEHRWRMFMKKKRNIKSIGCNMRCKSNCTTINLYSSSTVKGWKKKFFFTSMIDNLSSSYLYYI